MKVCLVIPPKVEGKYVHREDKHVSMHEEPFVPYTAPLIYALIEQEIENVELSLIKADIDDLSTEEALARLDDINPDIIVCLMGWISIPWDRKMAETKYPTIAIIVQQWLDQREAVELYKLKNKYTLYKEIEAPLTEALNEFKIKGEIKNAAGVIIENNGEYKLTASPNLYNMKNLPLPNFKVFELEKYFEIREKIISGNRARMVFINTMKSCPFQCSFCGQANDGTKVRNQEPEYVVRQMQYLHDEYGITKFEFIDNVFTTNKKRAVKFANVLIESGLKIKYSINDRLGEYDKALADLLKKSGCFEVRIGIETTDPKVQKFLNKELDFNLGKKQLQIIKDAGMLSYLYFMVGIPGETKKSLDMNAQFISDVDADNFTAGPLFIMPGSPLFYRLRAENKILVEDWSEYRKFDKLTYINESYKDINEVNKALEYMKKKVYIVNMTRFDRGFIYVVVNFIKYINRFQFTHLISSFIPMSLKGKLKDKIYKR